MIFRKSPEINKTFVDFETGSLKKFRYQKIMDKIKTICSYLQFSDYKQIYVKHEKQVKSDILKLDYSYLESGDQ